MARIEEIKVAMEAAPAMSSDASRKHDDQRSCDEPLRDLPAAARRALEEARERQGRATPALPRELNGRGGHDPVRYGDWEVRGLAADF